MLTKIVAELFPSYLLFVAAGMYTLPGRAEKPKKHAMQKVDSKSEIEEKIREAAESLDLEFPVQLQEPFRIRLEPMQYMPVDDQPASYRAAYTFESSVKAYSFYGGYNHVDPHREKHDIEDDKGGLDPKLDHAAIMKILQAAKRENMWGVKTYINPMLKEKFDRWKIFNDADNKLWYEIVSL